MVGDPAPHVLGLLRGHVAVGGEIQAGPWKMARVIVDFPGIPVRVASLRRLLSACVRSGSGARLRKSPSGAWDEMAAGLFWPPSPLTLLRVGGPQDHHEQEEEKYPTLTEYVLEPGHAAQRGRRMTTSVKKLTVHDVWLSFYVSVPLFPCASFVPLRLCLCASVPLCACVLVCLRRWI